MDTQPTTLSSVENACSGMKTAQSVTAIVMLAEETITGILTREAGWSSSGVTAGTGRSWRSLISGGSFLWWPPRARG